MGKKYTVDYCSGSTGYGWSKEYDRLDEFEDFINECRLQYSAKIQVWDSTLNNFIFRKSCSWKPDIDMLHDIRRDMRTTDRQMKKVVLANAI